MPAMPPIFHPLLIHLLPILLYYLTHIQFCRNWYSRVLHVSRHNYVLPHELCTKKEALHFHKAGFYKLYFGIEPKVWVNGRIL